MTVRSWAFLPCLMSGLLTPSGIRDLAIAGETYFAISKNQMQAWLGCGQEAMIRQWTLKSLHCSLNFRWGSLTLIWHYVSRWPVSQEAGYHRVRHGTNKRSYSFKAQNYPRLPLFDQKGCSESSSMLNLVFWATFGWCSMSWVRGGVCQLCTSQYRPGQVGKIQVCREFLATWREIPALKASLKIPRPGLCVSLMHSYHSILELGCG